MATREETVEILTVLAAAWPKFTLKKETITAYYMMLKDIDADALRAATLRCANSGDFFPSVHELRRAVAENMREAAHIPSAYEAWEEVTSRPKDGLTKRVVEEDGQWIIYKTTIPWSHPIVEKVAYQMGWPSFPVSDEIGVDRAHFLRAYEYALDAAMRDSVQLPEVRGYIESGAVKDGIKRLSERLER